MKRFKILALGTLCTSMTLLTVSACSLFPSETPNEGTYKITFSLNYDGANSQEVVYQYVNENETAVKPEDPQREDYVFLGWYRDSAGIEPYSFDSIVSEDIRLFAKWGLTTATVAFELGDGSTAATQSVNVGETVSEPSAPTREDYRFAGWYSDAKCTIPFDFNTAIESNTTLYAKWEQLVATVTFFEYDGAATTEKVDIGGKISAPALEPEREDYIFTGWYADSACRIPFEFDGAINGNTTVYAGWQLTVATVTLNGNYETSEDSAMKVNVGDSLPEPVQPERYGYNFLGWYLDAAGTTAYDFTGAVNGNLTLYAKWEASTFTVTFNLGQANVNNLTADVVYGDKVTLPDDPERSGYVFIGWYTDAACSKIFNQEQPIEGDMIIYAGWQSDSGNGEYSFHYYLNYGNNDLYIEQSYKLGRKIVAPEAPAREGYYFVGWAMDEAGTELFDFNSERVTKNTVLYAKWFRIYTFEAEYTYLTGKNGQGLSDNVSGTQLIVDASSVQGVNGDELGASNGYYISKLYYNGAYLEFDVTSDKTVTDAVIILRLSVEYYNMEFTDNTWQVIVNGNALPYGSLTLSGAVGETDKDADGNSISGNVYKRPFENYELNVSVTLNEGTNKILLQTNNNNVHNGTFQADTPLIDCMYICSDAVLTWTVCYPENVGKSMSEVTTYSIMSVETDRDRTQLKMVVASENQADTSANEKRQTVLCTEKEREEQ